MKKFFILMISTILIAGLFSGCTQQEATVYSIEVESSSSMFKIVECQLTDDGETMTALMTLSGTGYEKLYMGTGEEALVAEETDYIYFDEDDEGMYTYAVPVEALDQEIDCAAWSINKEQWYDRVLVFQSETMVEVE